jgi:aspartyl-tRNA(Asn)/glutamyl-tRNA(Gln) amidotransferase subunit B
VLLLIIERGKDADEIVREKGLLQIEAREELSNIIRDVIRENEKTLNDFRSGKQNAFTFLVGQVMRKTSGRANPKLVNELFHEILKEKGR